MRLALEQARLAREHGDLPFGAVIVREGTVLVSAENSEGQLADVTAHAETIAVSAACRMLERRDLSDCIIYSSMEPCPMCSAAIFFSNIPRIVYALSRDDLPHIFRQRKVRIAQLAQDWDYRPEVVGGVLRQEAKTAFDGIQLPLRVVPRYHQPVHLRPQG
ncbi:MAG: tRNA-specific adenosine deaminase [Patescibacteria group bacterium]|nr:tRNA-specific adenosine deaminase [Patescibacteria group bacterium]